MFFFLKVKMVEEDRPTVWRHLLWLLCWTFGMYREVLCLRVFVWKLCGTRNPNTAGFPACFCRKLEVPNHCVKLASKNSQYEICLGYFCFHCVQYLGRHRSLRHTLEARCSLVCDSSKYPMPYHQISYHSTTLNYVNRHGHWSSLTQTGGRNTLWYSQPLFKIFFSWLQPKGFMEKRRNYVSRLSIMRALNALLDTASNTGIVILTRQQINWPGPPHSLDLQTPNSETKPIQYLKLSLEITKSSSYLLLTTYKLLCLRSSVEEFP